MKNEILILSISIILTACASTSKQGAAGTSEGKNETTAPTSSVAAIMDDNKVFLVCEEFTSGRVTSRWIVKNTLDYAVKYTYKLKTSGSNETILVLGRQGELISNYAGYCRDSSKPIFISYTKY
jgi:hypothetical protein